MKIEDEVSGRLNQVPDARRIVVGFSPARIKWRGNDDGCINGCLPLFDWDGGEVEGVLMQALGCVDLGVGICIDLGDCCRPVMASHGAGAGVRSERSVLKKYRHGKVLESCTRKMMTSSTKSHSRANWSGQRGRV
jgi:hypothetical protein